MLVPPVLTIGGASTPEETFENVKSALGRRLPVLDRVYEPHGGTLSIAAGGPSLQDTWRDLKGRVVTVNKAHDFLLERGVRPRACALLCPVPMLAEAFTPQKDVQYFVASKCHPSVFDKLQGFDVVLWHAKEPDKRNVEALLPQGHLMVSGGSTVSLRWYNIGAILGFRDFHGHGLDSSFRRAPDGKAEHHAYDYPQDDRLAEDRKCTILGYETYLALYSQVTDYFLMMDAFDKPGIEPCTFTLHGDGLLQHAWKQHNKSLTYRTQQAAA